MKKHIPILIFALLANNAWAFKKAVEPTTAPAPAPTTQEQAKPTVAPQKPIQSVTKPVTKPSTPAKVVAKPVAPKTTVKPVVSETADLDGFSIREQHLKLHRMTEAELEDAIYNYNELVDQGDRYTGFSEGEFFHIYSKNSFTTGYVRIPKDEAGLSPKDRAMKLVEKARAKRAKPVEQAQPVQPIQPAKPAEPHQGQDKVKETLSKATTGLESLWGKAKAFHEENKKKPHVATSSDDPLAQFNQ